MSTRPKKDRFWEKRAKAAKARIGELEAECKRLREGWAAQMSSPCPVCEGAYTDSVSESKDPSTEQSAPGVQELGAGALPPGARGPATVDGPLIPRPPEAGPRGLPHADSAPVGTPEFVRARTWWRLWRETPQERCSDHDSDLYLAELLVAVCAEERARTDDEYVRLSIGMAEAINHALGTFGDDYPGRLDPLREAVEAFEAFIVSDDAPCMKIGDAIEAMKQAAWDAERARRAAAMPTGGTDNG